MQATSTPWNSGNSLSPNFCFRKSRLIGRTTPSLLSLPYHPLTAPYSPTSSSPHRDASLVERLMVKTLRLTISRVIILSIALRLLTLIALELLTSQTRAFDTSHELFEPTSAPSTLRWDAVHFASIALHGYQHELKLAFFPGWPWLMQCTSTVIGRLRGGRDQSLRDVVWAGTGLNVVANAGATLTLYK